MDQHAPPPSHSPSDALVKAARINELHLTEAARPLSWGVIPLWPTLPDDLALNLLGFKLLNYGSLTASNSWYKEGVCCIFNDMN